uniref:Uncharacterized protein n=1 Tax=Oncorhynchus kisutch TaxID=8019 RepID=A0A8C7G2W0_ONCKI
MIFYNIANFDFSCGNTVGGLQNMNFHDLKKSGHKYGLLILFDCHLAPPYGDIMKVETSGASWRTAKADGGNDEEHDRAAMDKYKRLIMKVAKRNEVDPAVICGIISRESRAGTGLDKHGRGDNGKAFGLMQTYYCCGEWNSEEHLQQGTEILIEFIKIIQEKFN